MVSFDFYSFGGSREKAALALCLVEVYVRYHTDNFFGMTYTSQQEAFTMNIEPELRPGDAFKEWLELSGTSASGFSRLVPCAVSLPGQWARGDARPSYEMARRIEHLTDGMVPRTLWYPPGPKQELTTDIGDELL